MKGKRNEIINWLLSQNDETIYKIEECKNRRSMNINNYMWVLLQALADKHKTTKEEIYLNYIHDKGIFRTIEIQNDAVGTITHLWKEKGIGWVFDVVSKDAEKTNLILYYGTSSYTNKQMSEFVDVIVQDCIEEGIEVMTPEELQVLKDKWK